MARSALGPELLLSSRIKTVERNLTPGDSLWRNDALSARTELIAISTELEQLPKVIPPQVVSGAEELREGARAEVSQGVNEVIKL